MRFSTRKSPYVRCDLCPVRMNGILSPDARARCHGCGGRPLVSDSYRYQADLRKARESMKRSEPPKPNSRPWSPAPGRAA